MVSRSLATFNATFIPEYEPARFHQLLAEKLEWCLKRKIRRLCISVPPQHGKSKTASVGFPAWALTKFPTLRFVQAGYSSDLSEGFSRDARDLVSSRKYLQFFPKLLNPLVNRQDFWTTMLGGYYYATSTSGGGTGRSADVLIVDDPHKNRVDAASKAKRNAVWSWFTSTATTRLAPDGIIIVIQTRWHQDDLIGRLTDPKRKREFEEAGLGDMNYESLSLEAICEHPNTDPLGRKMGDPLWPERRGLRVLAISKKEVGPYDWNALYQQRPNPPGGNIVDVKKFKVIRRDQVPEGLSLKRGWDLAVSDKTLDDYSAGAYGGMDADGNIYLVHMDRKQRLWPEQKEAMFTYIRREAIGGMVGVEAVGAWKLAASDIREEFKGQVIVKDFSPSTDKTSRAMPWLAKIDAGMFYLVEGTWNQDFIDEVEQFPNSTFDDQVDAVSVLWELFFKGERMLLA